VTVKVTTTFCFFVAVGFAWSAGDTGFACGSTRLLSVSRTLSRAERVESRARKRAIAACE